jgi:hypothetical protein
MSHTYLSQPTDKINTEILASDKNGIQAFLHFERNNEGRMLQTISFLGVSKKKTLY